MKFIGMGYRGGDFAWHERGTTAADIVAYERDELGNDNTLVGTHLPLDQIPANQCEWVTADRETAERYGEVTKVFEADGAEIIVTDDENGYLITWWKEPK